jgi:thiamine biosynthesis lipoprotein
MKKDTILNVLIVLAVISGILIIKGRRTGKYIKIAGRTQGTFYQITYESKGGENLKNEIESLLADFDKTFSTYLPSSIISRVNNNDTGVYVNNHFIKLFNKAYEVYKATDGAFDITVAPVVNAWGFGFTEKADVDSSMVDSLLQYVGMNKVKLHENRIMKEYNEIMLDANGIAQGYSVDVTAEFLDKKGIRNYLVEIGGEVKTRGVNVKGDIWKIGIDKPIENNFMPGRYLQARLQIENKSLATSGNYRKFYEKDGVKYVHSIDPKTGYPVLSNLLSATVLADECMTADAYATAFMVMGIERAKAILSNHKELGVYLIYSDDEGNYREFITEGLKENIME